MRSGKRLDKQATEIIVEFKPAPHTPWSVSDDGAQPIRPNLLIVNVSPEEGIVIRVEAKQPGQEMRFREIDLDYCSHDEKKGGVTESPSAYEHLLLDSLRGDPTFFARADEVEAAWEIVQPVIKKWAAVKPTDFPNYKAGSSGPSATDDLLRQEKTI